MGVSLNSSIFYAPSLLLAERLTSKNRDLGTTAHVINVGPLPKKKKIHVKDMLKNVLAFSTSTPFRLTAQLSPMGCQISHFKMLIAHEIKYKSSKK
jgi:hypothetical protein